MSAREQVRDRSPGFLWGFGRRLNILSRGDSPGKRGRVFFINLSCPAVGTYVLHKVSAAGLTSTQLFLEDEKEKWRKL